MRHDTHSKIVDGDLKRYLKMVSSRVGLFSIILEHPDILMERRIGKYHHQRVELLGSLDEWMFHLF